MITRFFKRWVARRAMRKGKSRGLWLRLCRPRNDEIAEFVRRHGGLYAMGSDCRINPDTLIADPAYMRLGNNVTLSSCALIGHDGSVGVLNRAYGVKLDSVGKIDIRDNVFIGYGAIVVPGVKIGPNAIIAAGAVVSRDVAEGEIAGGVPARPIGRVEEFVRKFSAATDSLPWRELLLQREGDWDADLEPRLVAMRIMHFYGGGDIGRHRQDTEQP